MVLVLVNAWDFSYWKEVALTFLGVPSESSTLHVLHHLALTYVRSWILFMITPAGSCNHPKFTEEEPEAIVFSELEKSHLSSCPFKQNTPSPLLGAPGNRGW